MTKLASNAGTASKLWARSHCLCTLIKTNVGDIVAQARNAAHGGERRWKRSQNVLIQGQLNQVTKYPYETVLSEQLPCPEWQSCE